ncbi:MAG: hypothetical protein HZA32_18595 [Opitutae bacterium]|nr:hypothetical protein [Opitutae bacterium]
MKSLLPSPSNSEAKRWLFLAAIAAWLLHPFATGRMIGTGDALWYAQMLADFVAQIQAGHFPVFVGQTEWAWNGAVYPLRVAPLYQHAGALIDLLTLHHLGVFALQHAIVIVSGVLGIVSAYLCLRAIDPASPWRAAGLATLYSSCPGVLGTIYTQDLYMTWMVLPFLPIALLATVRSYEKDDTLAQLLLATGLAGAWLAHAPIALWLTLIVGAFQIVRLVGLHRTPSSWRRAGIGAGAFLLLGSYPFISVAMLKAPGSAAVVVGRLADDQRITQAIREVFPRVLQPLSEAARALSDLQLGYGCWLVAAVATALCICWPERTGEGARIRLLTALLLCAGAMLLVLLLPVPILTEWLWAHVPGPIKRITFYWPMHRFYLLLAMMFTVSMQLAVRGLAARGRALVLALVGVAVVWSLWESRQLVRAGGERTASRAISERALRPENRLLMNHSYGLFAALPECFTNGVADPRAELRLRDARSGDTLEARAPSDGFIAATGHIDANPGILRLDQEFTLEPGFRYALDFRFGPHDYTGVLQLAGTTFFREYQLPHSGSPRAFGTLPGNSPTLPLWTTARAPERIVVRFIPTGADARPSTFCQFGEWRLRKLDPAAEPVEILSFSPLRVRVRASADAILATPRMALLGYQARVDAMPTPVIPAADGTLNIPVPQGEHTVELSYRAPFVVSAVYGVSLVSWLALFAAGTWEYLRPRNFAPRG